MEHSKGSMGAITQFCNLTYTLSNFVVQAGENLSHSEVTHLQILFSNQSKICKNIYRKGNSRKCGKRIFIGQVIGLEL